MATRKPGIRLAAHVFRAHNPQWSWAPTSGEGARRYGGRFNRPGLPALYTSLDLLTALLETTPLGRPMDPVTLVSYEVDCANIFDATKPATRRRFRITLADLRCDTWEEEMLGGSVPRSQSLADTLILGGYAGLLVRSFARHAGPHNKNLVLWKWSNRRPHRVRAHDPFLRLEKPRP